MGKTGMVQTTLDRKQTEESNEVRRREKNRVHEGSVARMARAIDVTSLKQPRDNEVKEEKIKSAKTEDDDRRNATGHSRMAR